MIPKFPNKQCLYTSAVGKVCQSLLRSRQKNDILTLMEQDYALIRQNVNSSERGKGEKEWN